MFYCILDLTQYVETPPHVSYLICVLQQVLQGTDPDGGGPVVEGQGEGALDVRQVLVFDGQHGKVQEVLDLTPHSLVLLTLQQILHRSVQRCGVPIDT